MLTTGVYTGRSRQLAPLSSEHKDGLQFANRIREGLLRRVSPEIMKDYFFWYWRNHIRPHFRHEEDVLLPYFPPGNKLALQMKTEHDMIRELMLCLDEEADTVTLSVIAEIITEHISFEERELFSWLENELAPEQLEKILKQLEQKPIVCAEEWTIEFWNHSPK